MSKELNSYNLSEINLVSVMKAVYGYKNCDKYINGGFYLIYDNINNMGYVGKSILVLPRIKNHIMNANRQTGIFLDRVMHNRINDFSFYKIASYKEIGINFFTRKLESVVEREFILEFKTLTPNGYNQTI